MCFRQGVSKNRSSNALRSLEHRVPWDCIVYCSLRKKTFNYECFAPLNVLCFLRNVAALSFCNSSALQVCLHMRTRIYSGHRAAYIGHQQKCEIQCEHQKSGIKVLIKAQRRSQVIISCYTQMRQSKKETHCNFPSKDAPSNSNLFANSLAIHLTRSFTGAA